MMLCTLLCLSPAGATELAGQPVPISTLTANSSDFDIDGNDTALHYYGVGGWGIQWRGEYLLLAPYFSNHNFIRLHQRTEPDSEAISTGIEGTPFQKAGLILVGHGHVDHAADISGFPAAGLPPGQAGIVANKTTLNMLASLLPPEQHFRCTESPRIDLKPIEQCTLAGFRITPLNSDHAPNVKLLGKGITVSKGGLDEPQTHLPERPIEFMAGETWAFLIDLLDSDGAVVFRIHYMDAAAGAGESSIPSEMVSDHAVDLHIACVPGFDYIDQYPEWAIRQGKAGYVMLGHWEDFFQPRNQPLKPVTFVLNEKKLNQFVERVESSITEGRDVIAPTNKLPEDCPPGSGLCGPRGKVWTLPIPGETFVFKP